MAMSRRARRRLALLLMGAALAGVSVAGAVGLLSIQRFRMVETKRERGLEAYRQGRFEDALSNLGSVFARRRSDLEVALAIADARRRAPLENSQHLISSQAFASHALELDPENVKALRILLDDHAALRQRTELLDTANRLLEIEPADLDAHAAKVQALLALGRNDEAVAAADAMVAAQPDAAEAYAMLIATRSVAGEQDQALRERAEAAYKAHSNDAGFAVLAAEMRFRVGDQAGAQEAARAAAGMDLSDPKLLDGVIRVLDRVGLAEEASRVALRSAQASDATDPSAVGAVAVVAVERAWRVGDIEQARQAVRAALSRVGVARASDDVLGWTLVVEGESGGQEAAPGFDVVEIRSTLEERKSARAAYWRDIFTGRDALLDNRWTDAREQFRSAMIRDPEARLPQYMLAQTEARLGDVEAAAARFGALAARDPSWYAARRMQARSLLDIGRPADAHTAARLLLTVYPTRVDAALLVLETGAALAESGAADAQTVDALAQLGDRVASELTATQPAVAATALLRAARALAATGRRDEVGARIDRVAALADDLPATEAVALALSCRRFGAPGAERLLAMAQARAPDSPEVVHALALSAADAGRPEDGVRMFDQALAEASSVNATELQRRKGLYLERIGDPGSLEALRAFAEAHPDDARAQLAVLRSRRAWSDERIVSAALSRLGGALGQSSPTWRLNESRRLLTFERSQASASKVVTLLADVVRNDPSDAMAAALFAEAQLLLDRNVAPAAEALGRAVDANPDQASLYPTLILALRDSGRSDEARRRLREFAALTGLDEPLRRRRAALALSFGLADAAVADLSQLAQSGDPADLAALASALLAKGDVEGARSAYARIERDADAGVDPRLAAAVFFARTGEEPRAERLLDQAAQAAGDDAMLVRAAFASKLGRLEEAESALRAAIDAHPSASAHAALAQMLIRRNRLDEAKTTLADAQLAFPDNERLRMLARMRDIAAQGPISADAVWMLLDEAGALDEQADATASILDALEARGEEGDEPWRQFAQRMRDLTRSWPAFYPAWALAIQAVGRTAGPDEAVALARDAAGRFAADPRPARIATQLLLQTGRLEEAGAMATQWRARPGADAQRIDLILADLDLRRNRPGQARARLAPMSDSIIAGAARDPQAVDVLLRTLVAVGQTDDALRVVRQLAESDLRWWGDGVQAAAAASLDRKRAWLLAIEPALPAEARASLVQPLAGVWWSVAVASSRKEDVSQVVRLLQEAAERNSGALDANAALLLASGLEQLDQLSDAERWYRESLRQAPAQHAALNNLAYLLLKTGGDAEEAVDLAQRALSALDRRSGSASARANYLDTLGAALLAAGRAKDAEAAFRQAIALGSAAPASAQLGLAEALAAVGDTRAAQAALQAFRFAQGQATPDAFVQQRLERLERALADQGA